MKNKRRSVAKVRRMLPERLKTRPIQPKKLRDDKYKKKRPHHFLDECSWADFSDWEDNEDK